MTPLSGTGAVAGSTSTMLLSTATRPRPFTVPSPVPPVLRSRQKEDDGYPEEEALLLPKRQRHVLLMMCGRGIRCGSQRLERARYRLALNSPPPETRPTRDTT